MPDYLEIGRTALRERQALSSLLDEAVGSAFGPRAKAVVGDAETKAIGFLHSVGIMTENPGSLKMSGDVLNGSDFSLMGRAGAAFDQVSIKPKRFEFILPDEFPGNLPKFADHYRGETRIEGIGENGKLASRVVDRNDLARLSTGDLSLLSTDLEGGIKPQYLNFSGFGESMTIRASDGQPLAGANRNALLKEFIGVEASMPMQLHSLNQDVHVGISPDQLRKLVVNHADWKDVAIDSLLNRKEPAEFGWVPGRVLVTDRL